MSLKGSGQPAIAAGTSGDVLDEAIYIHYSGIRHFFKMYFKARPLLSTISVININQNSFFKC